MAWFFLALAALALAAFGPAPRGVEDPRAFVQQRYSEYLRGNPRSIHLDDYASERLIALADALGEAEGGEDRLGFDWWVNGQDWQLSDIRVTRIDAGPDDQIVLARFANFGREGVNRFHFVRQRGRWFLDDVQNVTGGEIWMLSSLLRQAADDASRIRP